MKKHKQQKAAPPVDFDARRIKVVKEYKFVRRKRTCCRMVNISAASQCRKTNFEKHIHLADVLRAGDGWDKTTCKACMDRWNVADLCIA